ncbi:metallophosphoesterase [Lacticaseibacillus suilingensis]|uniref:metallophosphoesterase n=1 Tax=Lacticaseibacillus suilingensis TaxID=2799577 RepID=UPI0022E69027|nr:metallophosphoesterase [Lacticaseibacillus suilingensis]
MFWTDKQINQLRQLASNGLTKREAADQLGVTYDSLRKKARRVGVSFADPEPVEYDADGTQSSETIIKVVRGQQLSPDDILRAHGYDPKQWKIARATSNFWKQTPTATLYQSKIQLVPASGISPEELSAILNGTVEPVTVPTDRYGERNLIVPLYDLHFGITTLLQLTPTLNNIIDTIQHGYQHIVIILGGDTLHSDYMNATMTVKGTQLDHVDTVRAWQEAKQFTGAIIEAALANSKHVTLYAIGGNHDFDMQWAFVDGLADRYPQLSVHNTTEYRQAFRLGHVGILIAHGDMALRKLPMLFATEYPEIWSNSSWREVLYGHFHHEVVNDDSGVIIRQLGTPKPSDNYEKKNGYTMSSRSLKLFEYDDSRLRVTYDE